MIKMKCKLSRIFQIFTENEQKIAITYRELTATVDALRTCEFLIILSKHPVTKFTDTKMFSVPSHEKAKESALFHTKMFSLEFQD